MKKVLSILLVLVMLVGVLAGCGGKKSESTPGDPTSPSTDSSAPSDSSDKGTAEEGKVFNIYAWNEEFKGFFEKYYTVPEGITVNWIINPSDGGVYQEKLDQALMAQDSAPADEKVDMFLAEADYIIKYVESDFTLDVSTIGVTPADTMYKYTVQAATDSKGRMKGVSFQCCPAALIYRRSIAKDVLGTDDPAKVQEALSDWNKFNEVAAKAKEKGYYMTASYVETYRTFSNNVSMPWVDENNKLQFDPLIETWIDQAKEFLDKGYTLPAGVWDDEKNQQMFADGKTMCFFGPAWYYNFCMGNAMDPEKGCFGDWAIIQGPQPYFWGGTWLLAAKGTDNPAMVKDIMDTFTINEEVCSKLVENEMQFSNNTKVNEKYANDPNYGNDFLGGQNDTAVFVELAKNIRFEHKTQYDQLLNEQLPGVFLDYFLGNITREQAYANFYQYVNEKYPAIVTPDEA
ncbi:MAG: ABC transporter substrate-binding protein [Clostridiaceae bacterium]|nr:ABC transporter substrate-binding protein [Clostridiaceae bacterium]